MKSSEYEQHDGIGLAKLLYDGHIAPAELMEAAIDLAEARNPQINALCCTRYGEAIELARRAELKGHFGAMPFLLKDSGLGSRFLASTVGSRLFAGMTSAVESTLNLRFMADGLLPFGRTTVPEFCMAPTTEATVYDGPTRNPWDPTRSPGGSSGGAAAAVASGIVPIAHGNDGGGSIRIPASCCGVFGLKPSRGLVPHGPARGEGWGGLATDGVLTRSVRDTAAALDGIAGMEMGQPYAAPPRPASYLARLDEPFDRPLRVAVWMQAWDDIGIAPECHEAIIATGQLLENAGHEVVQVPPPQMKYSRFVDAIIDMMSANVALTVNGYVRQKPVDDLSNLLEPAILDAYQRGKTITAETYALAVNRFHKIARQMESYMSDGNYDFILTPTLTQLPLKLGTLSTQDDFVPFRKAAGRYTAFLAIVNASGQPAASLPLYWSISGLPVGVQLIGRFGADTELLRVSRQLESAKPWAEKRPPLFA